MGLSDFLVIVMEQLDPRFAEYEWVLYTFHSVIQLDSLESRAQDKDFVQAVYLGGYQGAGGKLQK